MTPFVLKHVDIVGQSCSICHWSKRCLGCPIEPSADDQQQLRPVLLKNTYIACEWDIAFFEENSDPQGQNWHEHESVGRQQAELDKPHSLASCLKLFSKRDNLDINCNYCKKERPSGKTNLI